MATLIQENGIKGTHGVVAGHGITHSVPNHMVPDHEYCETTNPAQAPQQKDESGEAMVTQAPAEEEETPEIDIMINNVVCSFSVKCHLNLRQIALNGVNVEYRRENGMVTMKLRRPYTTASIWSSGRVTCTGATSEDQAKVAARRYARALEKLGFQVRFQNFRVVNVLGTCRMPFGIGITAFSRRYKEAEVWMAVNLHAMVVIKGSNPFATSLRPGNGPVLDWLQAYMAGKDHINIKCLKGVGAGKRWNSEADNLVLRISNAGVADLERDKHPV